MPHPAPPRTHVLPGDPPVEVILRRSRRSKRFSLRVSRSDGRVSLSLPVWAPDAEALAFLKAREEWLRGHLAQTPGLKRAEIGSMLPVSGIPHRIVQADGRARRAWIEGGQIHVTDPARVGPCVSALLKTAARDQLAHAVARHAGTLGRSYGRLTMRDPRSRWGSCSSKGDLMFSWRLMMTPPAVLDYVAAHEVAHLVEMNHAPRFWALCHRLCPDTDTHRAWLKAHGANVLSWRFDTPPRPEADPC